jgi:hypothetical protein
MAETNGNITKKDLRDALTEFGQHILHEINTRFDETNARLASIDSRLKLQTGLIQSGARAMARFSQFAETSEERWVALVTRIEALEKWRKKEAPTSAFAFFVIWGCPRLLFLLLSTRLDHRLDLIQADMKDLNKSMTALEIDVARLYQAL